MSRKRMFLFFILAGISASAFSQTHDSSKMTRHFSGAASITNNGISLIPSFSLGKPAVLFLVSLGGPRFSIDPELRFGLDGKPWTFLFWARYKILPEGRFRMNMGAHLGLNHRTAIGNTNGSLTENIVVRRYLAAELAPVYYLGKTITIGSYYLYSHGIDPGTVRNTHFITLNSNFSRIPLKQRLFLRAVPQLYYLNQDGTVGYYFNATVTLAIEKFPLSLSSVVNKELQSSIPGSSDFIWNLSLNYSFTRNFFPKPAAL